MTNVTIQSIEKYNYTGNVYNLEVEPNHPVKDDQYYIHADNGLVVHNCHPRDNIALRWLAAQLDMGYDLFDAIMHAREKQAKNMADELIKHQAVTGLPIYILGKAYKPEIDILDGSYSLLVGSYLEQAGARFAYIDPNTGDSVDTVEPCVALLAHNSHVTYGYTQQSVDLNTYVEILPGSVVVDPWREYTATGPTVTVVHYGNTRLQ